MYKLLIEDDEGGKTAVSLIRDEITIGRKEGNTIRLTERNVSRRHGRILREEDQIFIEEVSARYGIKKNGKKIDGRAKLQEGDVVLIGDYRLTLQSEAQKAKGGSGPKARAPGKADPRKETLITDLNEVDADRREETQLMQALPAKLVVISSNFAGEEFPLQQKEIVIGSGDDCHIIIDHLSVSRKHAKIVREGYSTYKIVDLNSKNGVKVSGDTYRATHLKRGDVVELGHVKLRFVEPGENYVFTPHGAADVGTSTKQDSGKKMMGLLLAGALVALLVGGVAFVMSGSSDDGATSAVAGDVAALELGEELALGDLGAGDERLDAEIERAGQRIEEGQLQRAIGTLETLQSMALSPEQQERVNGFLATAQAELPFKRVYDGVVEALNAQDYLKALEQVMEIPSHSMFYARLEQDEVFDEIFAAVVKAGYSDLEEGEFGAARAKAEEVLTARSGHPGAKKLLEEASKREEQSRMVASSQEVELTRPVTPPAANTGSRPPARRAAAQPRVSAEEANALFTSAARKVASGNPQGAVEDCTKAVRAGNTNCHRILGLAYAQLGQNAQACQHLERYLATGPANPGAIESQMDRLGCGQ